MARVLAIIAIAALIFAASNLQGSAPYRVIDLGVIGNYSEGLDINNNGWTVGHTSLDGDKGFLWTPDRGLVTYLQTGYHAYSTSINDQGQIVGVAQVPANPSSGHAFLFGGINYSGDLGALDDPRDGSGAKAISNDGRIVGWSEDASGAFHAASFTPLQDLGAGAIANDVNDAGLIVGNSNGHAVTWLDDQMSFLYEPFGATGSAALGVNASGEIVGYWQNDQGNHAALWQNWHAQLTPLPLWDAVDINDAGQVVGGGQVWSPDGSVVDLPGSGSAINNYGWVAGTFNGRAAVFEPIPEPSTFILAALCGLSLVRRRGRRY